MKIYGRTDHSDSELEMLCETNLVADPTILRELASFLYRCADSNENQGENWGYEHFESNEFENSKFVVFNPDIVDA